MKWRSLTLAVPSLVLLVATQVNAQSDEQKAGARAAAQAGGQAFMDKRYSEAADFFTRAESLIHSPVHLLYLARSYEKLGKLVKARESYIKIQNDDLPAGAPAPWKDAHSDADKELDALEPRIPYVTVSIQGAGGKPVTVSMDGAQVPSALVGVPRPVDPGEHRFEARAEGMPPASNTVTMKERRNENVVLTLGAAALPAAAQTKPAPVQTGPAAAPPAAAPPTEAAPPPPTEQPPAEPGAGHGPSPVAYVVGGAGVVGLVVGTAFTLMSNSSVKKANDLCTLPGGACPLNQESQIKGYDSDARSQRTVGTVGLAVGGALLATGAVLFVVTGKKKEAVAGVHPWIGLGSAGMSGRF